MLNFQKQANADVFFALYEMLIFVYFSSIMFHLATEVNIVKYFFLVLPCSQNNSDIFRQPDIFLSR